MNCLLKLLKNFKETFKSNKFKKKKYKDFRKSILYVVRLSGNKNVFGCAKPCQNCAQRLKEFGIHRIKYTDCENGVPVLKEIILN